MRRAPRLGPGLCVARTRLAPIWGAVIAARFWRLTNVPFYRRQSRPCPALSYPIIPSLSLFLSLGAFVNSGSFLGVCCGYLLAFKSFVHAKPKLERVESSFQCDSIRFDCEWKRLLDQLVSYSNAPRMGLCVVRQCERHLNIFILWTHLMIKISFKCRSWLPNTLFK